MKQWLFSVLLLPLFSVAQVFPFYENFEGLFSNIPPPGWGGGMKVMVDHGINDSKGLSARMSSAVTVDSSITPFIGPLTSTTSFSFRYRIVDYAFYPDNETNLDTGDKVEILISTDTINYQLIYLIDMDNHIPTVNFSPRKKVFVTQYAGNIVKFKIRCTYGHVPDYYVDFDTIVVDNDPSIGIEDVEEEFPLRLYPNPSSTMMEIKLPAGGFNHAETSVFNSVGEKIFQELITGNTELSTDDWSNGIYYLQVSDETKRMSRRFIVQH